VFSKLILEIGVDFCSLTSIWSFWTEKYWAVLNITVCSYSTSNLCKYDRKDPFKQSEWSHSSIIPHPFLYTTRKEEDSGRLFSLNGSENLWAQIRINYWEQIDDACVFCKSYCWQVKPWEYFCLRPKQISGD